ncbi:T9SS type A sorting domain-containing protein [Flavobacterium sp. CYK-4]|uniref:CotH kinase family protein n=1 Tax=Flavobacterium lotistagni TaxID=2709660 RepID=UPI00140C8EA5|nr:CotH kinase family protein [Flavobacterium lotistagni]NHM08112.1 T9SS type A sorting domain-containing protein [Flavobacterium lotistagni]
MRKRLLLAFVLISLNSWAQDFYDLGTIQEIRLTFANPNWHQILLFANDYTPAESVSINGTVFQNVGVKYKGNSSFSTAHLKNPFHIELDTYQNQDYQGIKDIKLSNVFYDPSFIRETLSYAILGKYMHAPRANYARVYVNDVLIGLYVNTESITKTFVKNHFGSDTRPFFKAAIQGGANLGSTNKPNLLYLGEDPAPYATRFEMKSELGWPELIALTNTLNNNTAQIETVLDVDRALWMLAFNNVLVNLDSYTGLLNHNYYLYQDDSGRFSPIVWDLNMSFGTFDFLSSQSDFVFQTSQKIAMSHLVQANRAQWPLLRKLLAIPRYKKIFLAHMQTILAENFDNDSYIQTANQFRSAIDAAVQADQNKFYTYTDFQNSLTTTSMVDDEFAAAGIVELMSGRKAFLNNLPDFTATKPVISEIVPSVATPLINTNISFTANVTNTNSDAVFFGYRTNLSLAFNKIQMFDDGAHNDGVAGDNIYGTTPLLINNAYLQYYIYAENNTIGAFSPARAEHEFHSIAAINNINPGEIAINELMAQNTETVTDPAGQFEDWIELYNNTTSPLLLDGLFLSDTETNLQKWQLPAGITLQPGGYLIIWADEDLTEEGLHADFKLSASGESVILSKADGTIIDSVTFGTQTANISYARNPNGTGNFVTQAPTFNANNETLAVEEILANNLATALYPNPATEQITVLSTEDLDRLEIYNLVGQKVHSQGKSSNYTTIDIGHLPYGTYMVKSIREQKTAVSKFVKI